MHLTHPAELDRSATVNPMPTRLRLAGRRARIALATAVSVLGVGAVAGPAVASGHHDASRYEFRTIDNNNDPTFNQLLGINNRGLIAGYFGSGAQGHPNQGYLVIGRHHEPHFLNENFPQSVQTQVTGLNDRGVTVGFWSDMNNANLANDNFGFYSIHGRDFQTVNFPTSDNSTPPVNQLLGVNDRNVAVGFYNDAAGNSHGYEYDISSAGFSEVTIPGATSVTATAINNRSAVVGFDTNADGTVEAFVLHDSGRPTTLAFPGATMTQAFGVNDNGEVVGAYQLGSGSTATAHGFTWTLRGGFQTVDDPNGVGTTTINGVNDRGQLVGFYVDGAGNTDGMLADPGRDQPI